MKKIFSAIISSPSKGRLGGVLFALLATTTLWAYDFQSGDLYYNITSSSAPYTVEVTSKNAYNDGVTFTTITIPKTVTYGGITYSVTSIGDKAFLNCSSLTSVTIGNSVTSIGYNAFNGCTSITSITIPNSVTSIESQAFLGCSSLTSVTIGNNVTSIGYNAFRSCSLTKTNFVGNIADWCKIKFVSYDSNPIYYSENLYLNDIEVKDLIIPDSVISIHDYAFYRCFSLTSVSIGNSVTSIGERAFSACSSLTSVTIGNSVTSIGYSAFEDCSSLTSITIPNSVTSIADEAFMGCSSLTSITIPNGVTSIGGSTFESCSSLRSITIPNSVTRIGSMAFRKCSSLTSITIPNSVTEVAGAVFIGCSALETISLSENITELPSRSVSGVGGQTDTSWGFFENCSSLISITIPNSIMSIGRDAFRGCSSLTSITIPNSVTEIGNSAFYGCSSLTSITIPNSVTSIAGSIEGGTFYGCSSLTSITIPNSVTNIGSNAFSQCSSLKSIIIPNSVVEVGYAVFRECEALETVTLSNNLTELPYFSAVNYPGPSLGFFEGCSSLTSIVIPNKIITIKPATFHNCSSLSAVTIGNSVQEINRSAFSGCYSLKYIVVSKDNTTYDSRENCNAIIETTTNTLVLGGQNTIIPNSVTSIGEGAFSGCSSLTSITIPNSVTSIRNNAFNDCSSITSITIPDSVTSIGDYAFRSCDSLAYVHIGSGVTNIGKEAFWACSPRMDIYVDAMIPPILGDQAFDYRDHLTFYIPCGTRNAYLSSDWEKEGREWYHVEQCAPNMCGLELYWEYADGRLIITGSGVMFDYTTMYPAPWDSLRSLIQEISLPAELTHIGNNAFYNCDSLCSITIPNGVKSIGDDAFEYCYGLTKTNYTGNVASWCKIKFGNYDANPIYYSRNFYINDQEIKDLVVPNIVDTIHNYAFCNCRSLKSITIPNGVKSIGDDAFCGCYSLISITVDDENVVYDSRNNCNAIIETANNTLIRGCQNTLIPNGITKILNNAFSWDIHMDTIYVEATIPPILGDESDDDFEFPGSYESICIIPYGTLEAYQSSSWANYVNYFIEQVGTRDSDIKWIMNGGSVADTLPTSLTASYKLSNTPTREGYGFIGWYDNPEGRGLALTILPAGYKGTLYAIWVGATLNSCGDHCYWRYLDNILTITGTGTMYDYSTSNPTPWDSYRRSKIHTISLSEGITSIGGWAFGECESITSITIPNSVTNIGDKAFWGCRKLDSIIVPNSVTHIGERAFYGCARLTSINLPNNITSIDKYLLGYCSSLVSVVIPNSVTTIGEMAFYECSALSAITIPKNVNYIEWGAFYGCNNIDSVVVEATIPPAIGERGLIFSSSPTCYIPCGTLSAYQSSAWAEQVGSFVEQCDGPIVDANKCGDNLYWAYTDGTLTITGTGDMYNYDYMDNLAPWNSVSNNIKNIVLPEGLTSIGEWAFYLCASVTSISIPEGVTNIGVRAFCNCSNLTSITIPNSVTSIGNRAFYSCYNLASAILSTNLSKIDKYLFGQCRTLTAITIPNNVTAIENGAFSGCSSLDSVSIEAITPPTLGDGGNSFSSSPTCYIPCGTLAAYQSSSWAEQVGSFVEQCNDNENNQSLISVTDATLSDWDNLPAEYVSSCVHQKASSLDGLKSMKVYADERHINLLVEYKPETITSLEWTNFRIYINTDNSDLTGGYGASWSDANTDILLETAVFASGKPNPYNPAVYKWWGEVGDNSWDGWYDPTIELTQENCWGAIICEGSTPAVGNSQVIGNYIEIQIDYKRIPADWNKNQFTLGVEIDQDWDIAGLLPNASNGELGSTVLAEKLLVNVHPINAPILIDGILYEITSNEEPLTAEVYACTDYTIAEVDIPASITHEGQIYDVTSIGNNAFSACTRLTSITIPNSVMSIGDAAFFACFGLTEVTIPNSVTSIGELAFYNCRSLASVTLEATTPPTFGGCGIVFSSSPTCYIPCGTLAAYQSSSWAQQVGGFVEQCDDNDNNQSLISVTDGTLSDWDYLPMEYLFETKCVEGASWDALKSVKVYADLTYINLVVEWDTEIVTDLSSVPFHVYLNVDNDAPTGGFGDQWVKQNIDLLLEGYFYLDGNPCAYQPDVALYAGTPLANEWAWDWTTIEALAASQLITKGVMEIQIEYGKLPVKLENTFTVGFDIQQSWNSVGVLPNAANAEAGNMILAEKMLVRINNVNAPTSIENTHSPSSITNTHKLLRNGQLIILHDGKTYTIMGAEIK